MAKEYTPKALLPPKTFKREKLNRRKMFSIKAYMEYERQSETIQLLSQLDSPEKSAKLGSPQGTYLIASKGTFFS